MKTYDIVIIGSGLAGLMTAMVCLKRGFSVLMIEKNSYIGGTSLKSELKMAICNSSFQHKANIKDNKKLFINDISKVSEYLNQDYHAKNLAYFSSKAFNFLLENGIKFKPLVMQDKDHSTPRTLILEENIVTIMFSKILQFNQFNILKEHELLHVKLCKNNYHELVIKNYKSDKTFGLKNINTVFATGGYSQDKTFRCIQNPLTKNIDSQTQKNANASSLKILLNLGAAGVHLEQMRYAFIFPISILKYSFLCDNITNNRFCNEDENRQTLAFNILSNMQKHNTNSFPIAIFDSKGIDSIDTCIVENLKKNNILVSFQNIKQICNFYKFDYKKLNKNLKIYNNFVNHAKDETFYKNITQSNILSIDKAPFFTMQVKPQLNYTQGGVMVNKYYQVQDYDKNIIKGIYACGEATGGVFGKSRLINTSSTDCIVSAYIASWHIKI